MKRVLSLLVAMLALLLLSVLVAGLLLWRSPDLAAPFAERYLQRHGIESLSWRGVNWQRWRIAAAVVEVQGELDGHRFDLMLYELQLDYHWRSLLRGRVHDVVIREASGVVRLAPAGPVGDEEPTGLDLTDWLPATLLSELPLDSLAIEALHLELYLSLADDPDPGVAVSGHIDWQGAHSQTRAGLNLALLPDSLAQRLATPELALELSGDADQPLRLALRMSVAGQTPLWFDLALQSPASARLPAWPLRQRSGTLDLTLQGEVDVAAAQAGLMQLQASAAPAPARFPDEPGEPREPGDAVGRVVEATLGGMDLSGLPPLVGSSRFELDLSLPSRVPPQFEVWLDAVQIKGRLQHALSVGDVVDIGLENAELTLAHTLEGYWRQLQVALEGAAMLRSRWTPATWGVAAVETDDALLVLPSPLAEWSGPFALEVAAELPQAIEIRTADLGQWRIPRLHTRWRARTQDQALALALDATLNDLVLDGVALSLGADLALRWQEGGRERLAPTLRGTFARGARRAEPDAWQASGQLREAALAAAAGWRLSGRGGQVDAASVDLRLDQLPAILAWVERYQALPERVQLAAGHGEFGYQWRAGTGHPRQDLTLVLSGLTGLVMDVAIQDARLEAAFVHDRDEWASSQELSVAIPELDAGVRLEQLQASARLRPSADLAASQWLLEDLSARVFGGAIRLARPVDVQLPFSGAAFTMHLTDWQLPEILALYGQQDLRGSGVLSGTLPVEIDATGVTIRGGRLESHPPGGVIAYGHGLGMGNPQLDMALRLLENFEYDVLSVSTDFQPSGDLQLGLRLSGRNRQQFDGRPVNFNINVEENVYALLRSLRLSSDLIEYIERRLQRR